MVPVRLSVPAPALVRLLPELKSLIEPLTVRVPPEATVHVWLAGRPTLEAMVVPVVLLMVMPLPAVLLFALVAAMVSMLPLMLVAATPLFTLRLLISKSAPRVLMRFAGVVAAKTTLEL